MNVISAQSGAADCAATSPRAPKTAIAARHCLFFWRSPRFLLKGGAALRQLVLAFMYPRWYTTPSE